METPTNALEYLWDVEVRGDDGPRRFGVALFKLPLNVEETSGDLDALVRACQKSVWTVDPSGARTVAGVRPWATTRHNAVIVQLTAASELDAMFRSRPADCAVRAKTPETEIQRWTVPIVYLEEGGSRVPGTSEP
jgi:hypothetical protein